MGDIRKAAEAATRRKTLTDRLRGIYRIPITDGLGPAGGEEPNNPNEFVRSFKAPPIQHEAAEAIDELTARVDALEKALKPFADEMNKEAFKTHLHWPDSQSFIGFKFKLGDLRRAAAATDGGA